MNLPYEVSLQNIVHAFQDLGDRIGVKKPYEGFVSGKLEATEKHLDDMRKLVFEPAQVVNIKAE